MHRKYSFTAHTQTENNDIEVLVAAVSRCSEKAPANSLLFLLLLPPSHCADGEDSWMKSFTVILRLDLLSGTLSLLGGSFLDAELFPTPHTGRVVT